ncbi:TetR/AcrR family transcriptional regulator [Ktedonobacter robiniae]|uniref:TetR family transcriptional regulator n=1 Tax=Ktedonobacter robiniae TaxID=2778365 RepID=A0ABQ3UWM3_9CHLR|nr:TetR/AcrR family transcriptional regulator [Ktedonobacter robiniae]GHO57236.1 TetR family transcriptional regulator [Ktedonobacter robiniae]
MTQKPEALEDLRVRRTRKLLQQAFIDLTVEKGFATLTVRDITERAMVNRSTFYRHYLDKYDLLEQYMNEIYELTEDQSLLAEKQEQTSPGPLNLLKHIQQYADFYRVMLSAKGDPHFTQRFRQNTEKRFRSFSTQTPTEPEADAPPIDLRLSCIAYAGIGATTWWLEQEQPCPPSN